MTRFVFTGLAALGVLAAITFWWRPQQPEIPHLVPVPLAETEPAAAEPGEPEPLLGARSAQPAPVVHVSPPVRVAQPAVPQVAEEPEAPMLGEPVLEEQEVLEVVERPDFEDGPVGTSGGGSSKPPAELVITDERVSSGTEPEGEPGEPPAPVDVQESGELIRRMLALYHSIRE